MAELFSDSTYSSSSSRCSSEIQMQNHQSIRSSQPTPQGRRGKELHPSKLISSDSDDENVRESKRQRQHSVCDKEISPSIRDIKEILISLCDKVDKNTRALKEIKQQHHSRQV